MAITSMIVVYAVLWFLIMLLILPFGVKSQQDVGHIEPGTPASAPDEPMIGRKMLWSTIGAAIGLAVIWVVITQGIITRADLALFAPFDMEW